MVTVPSPPPAPKDATAKTPAAAATESKTFETKLQEAPRKVAPLTITAADVIEAPATVDARKPATGAVTALKKGQEATRKPPLDSKQNERSSKESDRLPKQHDRSAVSDTRPPADPGDPLHRLWERIQASRFLSISIVLHAIAVLMAGGVVLYPAIVERADFVAGSDGKLVQSDDQAQPPDLPSYSQEREFAPQAPPLTAPLNALVTATQLKPTWTVKVVPPAPVRGVSDSMKGALASMSNRSMQSAASGMSTGAAMGRSGGMRSAMIFGRQITASRLGVILDVSGSAQPHLAVAVEEIQRGFGDALLILYPGCGMMRIEGKSEHVIRNLASIPAEELPNNAGYFTTASQIVDVMKIPEFEQMARRPSIKNTLLVSWYAPVDGTPDKLTNQTQVAFEDLMKRGVDAIYWFADFEDPIDPRVADPLIAQLTLKRIKVHLHNFAGRKINPEATNIAEKTGGTMNTDKLKK